MKKIFCLILLASTLLSTVSCDLFEDTVTTSAEPSSSGTEPVETIEEVIVTPNKGSVILNEAMASNGSVITDDYGEYSDWIELYNDSKADVSLKNFMLSDNPQKPTKFVFPDITLKAGEYMLIWASGRNVYNEETGNLHLPFKLSRDGEIVCLFNSLGAEIGRITYYDMPQDISAGPDKSGKTVFFAEPTPGEKNVEAEYKEPETTAPEEPLNIGDSTVNTLRINEYATKKCVTFTDAEGDYGAWVEIYNFGEKAVSTKGLYLSDDPAKPQKWAFPDVTVEAGAYIVVFMLGKDIGYKDGGEIHASFVLSGKEETLGIYNGRGDVIDSCKVYELISNITCGRDISEHDKWLFYPKATPGGANTVKGFDDIESARHPSYKSAYISEVAAVNATLNASPDGKSYTSGELYDYYDLYDFVEIKNPTNTTLDLSKLYIGKSTFEKAVQLPTVSLGAGRYRIVYFGDETKYDSKKDEIYVDMGLNRYGNDLYLFDENGTVVDSVIVGRLFDKTSAGRLSDDDDGLYYFTDVTPGYQNSTVTYEKSIASPSFSLEGGYVNAGTKLTITPPQSSVVYYTTDGSEPTRGSTLYTEPIVINSTMSVRARAYKSNALPSDEVTVSFIVGRKHNMPVIFLNTDVENLYSVETGIWADGPNFDSESDKYSTHDSENAFFNDAAKYSNYWKDWERPVSFTYIDENGEQVLSFNAGIKTFGQYSRVHDQKSVSINLRDKYGIKEVVYPFFGDGYLNVFSSFILRASGQDAYRAHIRDAFIAKSLLGQVNCEVMNYRPVVVYVNGEYYGIYDLRERITNDFVANHTGADPDNLDRIKGISIVQSGSAKAYNELYDFVTKKDMRNDENYKYVCSQMDIDNYIDYWIATIYFANTDPGNIKFYRERTEGAKWRWIPYDFDWSIGSTENRFDIVFDSTKKVYGILRNLIKNETFKTQFFTRFAELMKTALNPDRLLPLLREMTNEISEEMEYHIARWNYRLKDDRYVYSLMLSCPSSMTRWEKYIVDMEDWLRERDANMIEQLQKSNVFKMSNSELRKYGLID